MKNTLIILLFALRISLLTARIEYDYDPITHKKIKRYDSAGNGSKLCLHGIVYVLRHVDNTQEPHEV